MHEYGQGPSFDLNLAKSYYNQALENEPVSRLPIMLALARLWVRRNYADIPIMLTLLLASLVTVRHLRTKRPQRREVTVDSISADATQPLVEYADFPN
ncbi:unnamed protein product [Brassica rapa]|uniref:Uncharacterized protein n=2 Tax=Brassica TaxID=3705 RepID=A0A8D9H5Y5_BRACM|nr:unnamed protein product [Brassica napus]CAG7893475.1 unnamed protein product [Brassica rapa]